MSKSLTELMAEAIALKKGDKEAVLNHLPDGTGLTWSFGIGNRSKHVMLNEIEPDVASDWFATPEEAVQDVITKLKGATK